MNHSFSYQEPYPTKEQAQKIASLDISWVSVTENDSRYHSHSLVKVNNKRLKVAVTRKAVIYNILYIVAGVLLIAYSLGEYDDTNDIFALSGVLIGLTLIILGASYLFFEKSFVFDKALGYYWLGSPYFKPSSSITSRDKRGRLSTIIAIQILKKRVLDSEGDRKFDYDSYELNIVLETTERLNVMCAGSDSDINAEAKKLNAFLGVPIISGRDSSL